MRKTYWISIIGLLLLTACSSIEGMITSPDPGANRDSDQQAPHSRQSPPSELIVAAASDLQFAFTDIASLFEAQTGQKVTLVFGSSGFLTQQIENGAPYDLLAAANIDYIHQLDKQGLVLDGSIAIYGRGRLVLASNRQAGIALNNLQDLLDPQIKRIAMANPQHAPYGIAAQQTLESAGLWHEVLPKLVFGENVRQTLQYIQTGDAEVGIIALSVADVPEVTWVLIDESFHQPLDQALAILARSPNIELANQFIQFIHGEQGRPILSRYGFILPADLPGASSTPTP